MQNISEYFANIKVVVNFLNSSLMYSYLGGWHR